MYMGVTFRTSWVKKLAYLSIFPTFQNDIQICLVRTEVTRIWQSADQKKFTPGPSSLNVIGFLDWWVLWDLWPPTEFS